jgi:hypothetical protein
MCKNPSIAISSIWSYTHNRKFITEKLLFGEAWTFTYFTPMAPMQLGKFHKFQKSFTNCDQVVRVEVSVTSCFKCFIKDLHTSWTIQLYSWVSQAKAEWNSSKTISCSKIPERNVLELIQHMMCIYFHIRAVKTHQTIRKIVSLRNIQHYVI